MMAEKEYIERGVLKNNLHFTKNGIIYFNGKAYMDLDIIDKIVLEVPTADVAEVEHGKWIEITVDEEHPNGYYKEKKYLCPYCGRREEEKEPYCNCGVKMDEKENSVKKDISVKDMSRCHKCVYEMTCFRDRDFEGTCPNYKRDAPDGGYYG